MKRLLAWLVSKVGILLLVAVAAAAGYVLHGWLRPVPVELAVDAAAPGTGAGKEQEIQWWTCSMHPQIKQPKPGLCPICNMELIPVTGGEDVEATGAPRLAMSEAARKLAEIETAPAERRFVTAEIRMVGKVDYDETRLKHITAWVPGRLDRLYVDYTGVPVREGDHLVYLYSPDLLAAQEELLQALRALQEVEKSDLEIMRETARATVEAARERLRLWGLTQDQIAECERRGKPVDHLTIYSPVGGIVIDKSATEGMYVNTGTRIYTIADLSRVWVRLDAYESDMMWIRYGQEVEFATEAYPGELFKGRIAFVDPVLNERTRTVKLRVNVDNPEGKLKPGMFVRAVVRTRVARGGHVMDPHLAGKWICPMHPDVVREGAGDCDFCDMPLVRAESLGYVSADSEAEVPLVIPASAPLITGERAVVYVEVPGAEKPTFEGREVVLGPRAGDYYLVRSGLQVGEKVVTRGNFKIDSALQIQARPSMMSPEEAAPGPAPPPGRTAFRVPHEFKLQLDTVFSAYFEIAGALSRDNQAQATEAAKKLLVSLESVDMALLEGAAHVAWMKDLEDLRAIGEQTRSTQDLLKVREKFSTLSQLLLGVARKFGTSARAPLYRLRCPMAFDGRGADWLQDRPQAANPYFGAAMLRCGEVVETVVAPPAREPSEE